MTTPALSPLVLGLLLVDFVQVGIENLHPVEHNLHARTVDRHLLVVPLACRFEMTALGCLQLVKGAMVLRIHQLGILGMLVVEDLQFHARSRWSTRARVVNAQSVVASRRQQKIHLENIIGVLLFRDEVAPLADEDTVLDNVFGILPTRKVLTIKEGNSFLALGEAYQCEKGGDK